MYLSGKNKRLRYKKAKRGYISERRIGAWPRDVRSCIKEAKNDVMKIRCKRSREERPQGHLMQVTWLFPTLRTFYYLRSTEIKVYGKPLELSPFSLFFFQVRYLACWGIRGHLKGFKARLEYDSLEWVEYQLLLSFSFFFYFLRYERKTGTVTYLRISPQSEWLSKALGRSAAKISEIEVLAFQS